jgi:hypothetical protein
MNAQQIRLEEAGLNAVPWKRCGPDVSKRQWGTVREDYSDRGNAWNHGEDVQEHSLGALASGRPRQFRRLAHVVLCAYGTLEIPERMPTDAPRHFAWEGTAFRGRRCGRT